MIQVSDFNEKKTQRKPITTFTATAEKIIVNSLIGEFLRWLHL